MASFKNAIWTSTKSTPVDRVDSEVDSVECASEEDNGGSEHIVHGIDERQPGDEQSHTEAEQERRLRLKIDLRLCTIAGLICSLDLLDSIIISSASVTSLLADLDMYGTRYSVAIWIFSVGNIVAQLPSTVALRFLGPRIWFAAMVFVFGLLTLCSAFTQTWREMVAIRALLGVFTAGIYPCAAYMLSIYYTRREQQLRFAFLQGAQVIVVATGTIINYGLNKLNGDLGLHGWRHIFLWNGLAACVIGIATYWWMVDFPERAHKSFRFLSPDESVLAVARINRDRADAEPLPFSLAVLFARAFDPKFYGWAIMLFLLNLVTTALAFFLPIILQGGLGLSTDTTILLSAPPYYYAAVPAVLSSWVADRYAVRGPVIVFNCACLILGFGLFGFAAGPAARYAGVFLATGAYSSNWAALNAWPSSNTVGHWNRVFMFALITAFNRAGGIAGSYIVVMSQAPRYPTAVWVSIGSQILMVTIVAMFTLHFWRMNALQKAGKRFLEGVPGFRYTF